MGKPEGALCELLPLGVSREAVQWMEGYFEKSPDAQFIPSKKIPLSHKESAFVVARQVEDRYQGVSRDDLKQFLAMGRHYCNWQGGMGGEVRLLKRALQPHSLTVETSYNQMIVRFPVLSGRRGLGPLRETVLNYFEKRLNGEGGNTSYWVEWRVGGTFKKPRPFLVLLPLRFRGTASQYGNGDGFAGRGTAASTHGHLLRFNPEALTIAQRHITTGHVNLCENGSGGISVCTKNDRGPFHPSREMDFSSGLFRRIGNGSGYAPMMVSVIGLDGQNIISGDIVFPGLPRGNGKDQIFSTGSGQDHLLLAGFPMERDATLFLGQLSRALVDRYGPFQIKGCGSFFCVLSRSAATLSRGWYEWVHDQSGVRPVLVLDPSKVASKRL